MAKDQIKITFPKAQSVYPALGPRPDTRFDELGQYKADFRLPIDEAKPYIAKLQKIAKAHMGKALPAKDNNIWKYELDEETGEETGTVLFRVKAKNRLSKKTGKLWDRRPLLIDAKKNDLPSEVNPWGGTVYRVQAEVYCYEQPKKGLNLQPLVVQIIDLVSGGSSTADTSDFDEEEGFEADHSDFTDEDEGSSDDEKSTDDDGDY